MKATRVGIIKMPISSRADAQWHTQGLVRLRQFNLGRFDF